MLTPCRLVDDSQIQNAVRVEITHRDRVGSVTRREIGLRFEVSRIPRLVK